LKESRQIYQTGIRKINEMSDHQQLTVHCLVVTPAKRSVPHSNLQ
jgi:hypothetical protein